MQVFVVDEEVMMIVRRSMMTCTRHSLLLVLAGNTRAVGKN